MGCLRFPIGLGVGVLGGCVMGSGVRTSWFGGLVGSVLFMLGGCLLLLTRWWVSWATSLCWLFVGCRVGGGGGVAVECNGFVFDVLSVVRAVRFATHREPLL